MLMVEFGNPRNRVIAERKANLDRYEKFGSINQIEGNIHRLIEYDSVRGLRITMLNSDDGHILSEDKG